MHPTTFLGDGSFGPLSRCPEVKYSQPSQYPTNVVLIRKGNRPITLHSCRWRFNSVTMACQGPQIHNDLQNAILIHSYHASCSSPNYVLFQHHGNVNFSNRKFNKILVAFVSNTQQNADAIPSDAINKSMKTH